MQFSPLMFLSAFLMGIASSYLASKRGKNEYLWFAIGFFFGMFGIFAILFTQNSSKKARTAPSPTIWIEGPEDKFWYYLDQANEQQGPMSFDAFLRAFKMGKLKPTTYIWHEDLHNWTLLKEILKTENV